MRTTLLLVAMTMAVVASAQVQETADSLKMEQLNEVVVSGVRTQKNAPYAVTNIKRAELAAFSTTGQELPFLFARTPGVLAWSENGVGTGTTYMRIRGAGDSRINVTLDGVPLNSPEDQCVYWANMNSYGALLGSVQIQRGVGTSTNGDGAFGGTVALGQYLELFKLYNREEVVRKNIDQTQRLIAVIQAKHEQGMALKNDVTRYELQLQSLQLTLHKLLDQRTILNHQLCNQLGVEGSIVPDLNADYMATESDGETWLTTALTSSPAIKQAELAGRMADKELRLAKSELLPKVALVAADNLSGPFTYDLPPVDKNINYWYVGVGVKYSISSLFKQNKRVRQAETRLRQTEQARDVVAERLDNQVQQAYTYLQQAYVELATRQKSVELAQQNYQVVSDRYEQHLSLITDMIDASNVKLNAELDEVDARIGILFAQYRLKYVAGIL